MPPRARGFGLALDAGNLNIQGNLEARFARQINQGIIQPNPGIRARDVSAEFAPARMAEVYGFDSLWAGSAQLVDGRNPGRCGGGACNAPSCAYQYWNIGLPCNQQNMEAYMFQLPRYIWAQQRLQYLLLSPPAPFNELTNAMIGRNHYVWNVWLSEVYRAMALLRWASNVRWELVTSKISLPFEWGMNRSFYQTIASAWGGTPDPRDELLVRYMADGEKYQVGAPGSGLGFAGTMLMESPLTWAFHQAGRGYHPDSPAGRNGLDSGGDNRPLAWQLRVPQATGDFDPSYGAWLETSAPTMPAMPLSAHGNRRLAFEYQVDLAGWQNTAPPRGAGDLGRFLATGARADLRPDALAMSWGVAGSRAWILEHDRVAMPSDTMVVPTPLMQILIAKTRAEAYSELEFGTVVTAGLAAWAEMIMAMPPELRGVDARDLEAFQTQMLQSSLNETAAFVGAGFGAVAGLVATAVPFGTIVGAIIGIVGAIVTALMSAAYDIGLARPDRPTCPAPPLLRMMDDPETGACDFDAARRGVEEVLGKSSVIVTLIGENVLSPGAWFPALEALSQRPVTAGDPAAPPPDVAPASVAPWKVIAGVAGVTAVGVLGAKLFL